MHFTYFMAYEINKKISKNTHFENMTAGFALRCQNLYFSILPRDIHIEFSKQFKWNLYFYAGSGQGGPFWAELKLR